MGGELAESGADAGQAGQGADVLSELDLLSAEQKGSGLVKGDSENLLASSGLGSSIGADGFKDSDLGGLDDALADDDELVIADDDDDFADLSEDAAQFQKLDADKPKNKAQQLRTASRQPALHLIGEDGEEEEEDS